MQVGHFPVCAFQPKEIQSRSAPAALTSKASIAQVVDPGLGICAHDFLQDDPTHSELFAFFTTYSHLRCHSSPEANVESA